MQRFIKCHFTNLDMNKLLLKQAGLIITYDEELTIPDEWGRNPSSALREVVPGIVTDRKNPEYVSKGCHNSTNWLISSAKIQLLFQSQNHFFLIFLRNLGVMGKPEASPITESMWQ